MRLRFAAPALAIAVWPVWVWYWRRMHDGSDEPWGLLSLATLLVLLWRRDRGGAAPARVRALAWSSCFLALYAATWGLVPPLMRAGVAAAAMGSLFFEGPGRAAQWGLLGLSLPLLPTVEFYLGYPLRIVAAAFSAGVLQACGVAAVREGSLLHWAGESVMVDAPCSGIHMLWCGFYLSFVLAAWHGLNVARTAACAGAAVGLLVLANAVRATILFFKEAHLVRWPEWTHAGVGVAVFALAACALSAFSQRLEQTSAPS